MQVIEHYPKPPVDARVADLAGQGKTGSMIAAVLHVEHDSIHEAHGALCRAGFVAHVVGGQPPQLRVSDAAQVDPIRRFVFEALPWVLPGVPWTTEAGTADTAR